MIDGKAMAAAIGEDLARGIASREARGLRPPGLVTVLVGEDPGSKIYVGRKQRESAAVGMKAESVELPAGVSERELLEVIGEHNRRPDMDGILVQLPLPAHLDRGRVLAALDPTKDVDGLHPLIQGALFSGRPGIRPCTPAGCMRLIDSTGVVPRGLQAVVVGRSELVGKPVAMMLLERHATVVMCHSRTADLAAQIARADILVVAVGRPELVRGEWIKEGAVVVDAGMNRSDGRLVGDVEFESAQKRAAWITPVPGGVGPMTVAMLLQNTFDACTARED